MTLDEFVKKHEGKYLEVTGSIGAEDQCVDLVNGYIRDVLELLIIKWTNAVDFPSKVGDDYDYIKNTLEAIPEKGDLMVWGGRIGHIAIYLSGNINWFASFDQNWPTGSVCHKVDHSYNNVIGWLRPRKEAMSNMYEGLDLTNIESMKVAVKTWADVRDGEYIKKEAVVNLQKDLAKKDIEINVLKKEINTFDSKIKADLAKKDIECQRKLDNQKKDLFSQMEKNAENYQTKINQLENIIKELKKAKPELEEKEKQTHNHPAWMYKAGLAVV